MKKKILSISIIFILISFLFVNNSFAASNYPDVAETVEAFGHLYRKYVVISCNNNGEEMILLWVFGCSSEELIENSRFEITETGVDIVVSSLDLTANGDTLAYQSYNILDGQWNAHGYAYLYNGETKTLGSGSTDGIELTILESSHPVYYKGTDDIFSINSGEDSDNTEVPDYDAWYDSIFNGISDWVGTLLEMLVNPFGAIADGIFNLGKHFSGVLDFLNPTSENFILKQVWDFLTNIISYLNPFSEDFFAYKLVEILLDGLKGLFVPEDNYFSDYFDELNNWFSERLGFLYYPLELLFDLLDRMLNINFKEPVINISDIKEPTTNITLIKATSFNFNSLLDNSVFSNVHNLYLLIVDAGIYIGLVALLMKKYEEVMTK